ncbi:unnamed protein product [Linum tenue]|uniref:Uncharacterized protein n=1 Tax=Linum tenue TaxID=586396 RepID=A0AAV0H5Y1_9ROSI|nr:unnamed protein product [Linum tenue]
MGAIEHTRRARKEDDRIQEINIIIMRFPQFKQHLKTIGSFSKSLIKMGSIDLQELKNCLENLQLLNLKELEVEDLFDGSGGIQFNEFIALMCLIYLLAQPSSSSSPNN